MTLLYFLTKFSTFYDNYFSFKNNRKIVKYSLSTLLRLVELKRGQSIELYIQNVCPSIFFRVTTVAEGHILCCD